MRCRYSSSQRFHTNSDETFVSDSPIKEEDSARLGALVFFFSGSRRVATAIVTKRSLPHEHCAAEPRSPILVSRLVGGAVSTRVVAIGRPLARSCFLWSRGRGKRLRDLPTGNSFLASRRAQALIAWQNSPSESKRRRFHGKESSALEAIRELG